MPDTSDFSWKNARILVADDEPDMREIFSAWFRNLGCDVTEVPDGQAALEAAARDRFDAIVTDVRMPRVDGVQLVKRLHQTGTYTPVIVFVSGYVDLAISDAFDLGVEAVLTKPCERKELLTAVQRSLLRRKLVFSAPNTVEPPASENFIRESFPVALEQSDVALGRGGMSLSFGQLPFGATIGFSLSFAGGLITRLEGWGQPRWCDPASGINRIGIEFFCLDELSRAQFRQWLATHAVVSFIPKGDRTHSLSAP